MCNNTDLLVGYLYDDVTAEERRAFEAHLRECVDCRNELTALGSTREHLSMWAPPERALGFRIVTDAPEVPVARVLPFRSRWAAPFGLAAAAVLVLAAATAIANLEIRYDANGLVVRTGWARDAAQTASAPGTADGGIAPASWRADFAALEARLQQMERALAAPPAGGTMTAAARGQESDAEILRQVRAIVKEAESRQQVAFAQRLLQVMTDMDRVHRADMASLQQGLGQYQNLTDMEIMQTREQLNQLRRVTTRQEK